MSFYNFKASFTRERRGQIQLFVFVDSVVFILFLSLSCLESWRFSATSREVLLPSSLTHLA